jgi:hypothetical protein
MPNVPKQKPKANRPAIRVKVTPVRAQNVKRPLAPSKVLAQAVSLAASTGLQKPALDPAAQKKAAQRASVLMRKIAVRKGRIAMDFWFIGTFLREILRDRLYLALGFGSFEAMLAQHRIVSFTLARKLIAIAEKVPKKLALALGQEKSYALVEYINATVAEDSVAEIVEANLPVGGTPVRDASLRQVQKAAETERRKNPSTPKKRVQEARAAKAEVKLTKLLAEIGLASPQLKRSGAVWTLRVALDEIEAMREPTA